MPPPPPDDPAGPPAKVRWAALFQHAEQPLFVLGRHRRVRFVNAAWEQLTGRRLADVWGKACVRTGPTEPLFRTLAPPPEAVAGRPVTVRRPVPPAFAGPPWWELTVVPLRLHGQVGGYLGLIDVRPADPPPAARSVPAAVAALRDRHARAFPIDAVAGPGPAGDRLLAQVRLAAATSAPVWIVGEPGSGKETLARVIHHAGPRADAGFAALDCDGVQPFLLESLVFGRGGLAAANLGTVYLRHPAALPPDLQQRLAAWLLGPGRVPRAVCGATTSAAERVAAGRLRAEFQAGLAVLELRCPPLRERPDELPRFAEVFADRLNPPPTFAPDLFPALRAHRWPGNLRELFEVLAGAAAKAAGQPVTAAHLPRYLQERALLIADPRPPAPPRRTLDDILTAVEKRLIELALRQADGNQTEAAARLGVFRARLGRRIEALGIDTEA